MSRSVPSSLGFSPRRPGQSWLSAEDLPQPWTSSASTGTSCGSSLRITGHELSKVTGGVFVDLLMGPQ